MRFAINSILDRLESPTDLSTATYSAGSTQEEFFYRLPFEMFDLLWYGWEHEVPPADVARETELTPDQVQRVYNDFARKIRTTEYLRTPPLGLDAPAPCLEPAEAV